VSIPARIAKLEAARRAGPSDVVVVSLVGGPQVPPAVQINGALLPRLSEHEPLADWARRGEAVAAIRFRETGKRQVVLVGPPRRVLPTATDIDGAARPAAKLPRGTAALAPQTPLRNPAEDGEWSSGGL
jgi:hypothetical protein